MTKVRIYQDKSIEELESQINGFAKLNNYKIINVSLTTKIINYSNYVVACVVYEDGGMND